MRSAPLWLWKERTLAPRAAVLTLSWKFWATDNARVRASALSRVSIVSPTATRTNCKASQGAALAVVDTQQQKKVVVVVGPPWDRRGTETTSNSTQWDCVTLASLKVTRSGLVDSWRRRVFEASRLSFSCLRLAFIFASLSPAVRAIFAIFAGLSGTMGSVAAWDMSAAGRREWTNGEPYNHPDR